jgi:hypothetical protein
VIFRRRKGRGYAEVLEWLKVLYSTLRSDHPFLFTIAAAAIGAIIFGSAWSSVCVAYNATTQLPQHLLPLDQASASQPTLDTCRPRRTNGSHRGFADRPNRRDHLLHHLEQTRQPLRMEHRWIRDNPVFKVDPAAPVIRYTFSPPETRFYRGHAAALRR